MDAQEINKKRRFIIIIIICSSMLTFNVAYQSLTAYSRQLSSDVGIGFTTYSNIPGNNISNSYDDLPNFGEDNCHSNNLPQTGELLNPIILVSLGWAAVLLSLTIYLITRWNNEGLKRDE